MDSWAEVRRLHAAGTSIKEIVRRTGLARNTVRAALRSDGPPTYDKKRRGSNVDAYEPAIRTLLATTPTMPATVIAERIEWTASLTVLKDRVRAIRPDYVVADPADRLVHEAGKAVQCDLWFPQALIPLAPAQLAGPKDLGGLVKLPVLTMTWAYSRFITATLLPSRQGGDLLAGMWALLEATGAVPAELVWDRESAIGGTGKVNEQVAAFAGTLRTSVRLCAPRDPESKGVIERANGYLGTSFLSGRTFTGPGDFDAQLQTWLIRANTRTVRDTGRRPVDAIATDVAAAIALPASAPAVGVRHRARLKRDYYVRVDGSAYSVHPAAIGRFVEILASPTRVLITCPGLQMAAAAGAAAGMAVPTARTTTGEVIVADHSRVWARRQVIKDPAHEHAARAMRAAHAAAKVARERQARDALRAAAASGVRYQGDGTPVQVRALSSYDELFGIPDYADALVGELDIPGPARSAREHLQVVR